MDNEVTKYFKRFTKDEISTILGYFEQEIPKKAKKDEIVNLVSDFIGGHPADWLFRLPERDIRLLRTLCDAGPENWVPMESPEYPSIVAILGLIYVDDSQSDKVMATLDSSLYFPVASIINQVIKDKEDDGSFRTERMALGLLNIYGAIPVDDFVETIFDMYDDHETGRDIVLAMAECPIISVNRMAYKDDVFIVSPYAYDYESIIDGRAEFEEIKEYPVFSKETVIEAGASSPYCAFKNEEYEAVRNVLETLGLQEGEIRKEIHNIWLNSQFAADEDSAEEMFRCINDKIDEIESFDTYRHFIDIVAAYANSVPKWLLKGATANDAGLLQLSIKVDESMMEDVDTDDDAEQAEEQGPLKEFYKYNMAVRHVGPDDPCPCGSGLSYCHCHGKRLN